MVLQNGVQMAQTALEKLDKKEIQFFPDSQEKIFREWLGNIQDWCLSRQLWWGHSIPAWHCSECGEISVSEILDASTGQNAVQQVKIFQKVIAIDGLIITKLDGTSKGGVIIGLINEFELPLYYIGVGEKIEHLQSFNSELFAEALFS